MPALAPALLARVCSIRSLRCSSLPWLRRPGRRIDKLPPARCTSGWPRRGEPPRATLPARSRRLPRAGERTQRSTQPVKLDPCLAASEQVKSDHETSFAAIIGCRISEGGGPQVLSGLLFYINKSSRESRRLEVLFELPHRPGQHRVQAIIAAHARAVRRPAAT